MRISVLAEMAAKKICPDCGKTMAGYHYWYKGGWKCKKSSQAQDAQPEDGSQPAQQEPTQQPPQQQPTAKPVQQPPAATTAQQPADDQTDQASASVETQDLEITVKIIEAAKPYLDKEIEKINKIASKIGASAVKVEVVSTAWEDRADPDKIGEKVQIKVLTIKLTGTTPRITAADGSTWNFVGVITPSAKGKAIVKLTPGANEEVVKHFHQSNPYYCDYCKKVRNRNETFIVQNNVLTRQVGRNCLKDFVGGANPQAIAHFFEWFNTPEHLEEYLRGKASAGGDENEYGGGGRQDHYLKVSRVLELAIAAVKVAGGYVSSAAAQDGGRFATSSEVRRVIWGARAHMRKEEVEWIKSIHAASNEEAVTKEAQDIIEWFKSLPEQQINSSSFFMNVKTMIEEEVVSTKNLGYIVGLYPTYMKAKEKLAATKDGVPLVREWPEDWGSEPRPVEKVEAEVKFVRQIQGVYGTSYLYLLKMADGVGCSWKYSGKYTLEQGDTITVTGHLEKDDYYEPARIKFVPNRSWIRSELPKQIDALNEKDKPQ